jgi:lipopolysaccharide/colanic/teichoic acid biosynthesis glycosyltransferase
MSTLPNSRNPWLTSIEKRTYDVLGAGTGLILAAPVIALAALATAVHDRKNPFFVQQRLGQNGERFSVYKIRTLRETGDYGGIGRGPQDDRATKLGALLRKYAIDELPQLWNTLKGDMSLVGPRPPCDAEVAMMAETLAPDKFSEWRDAYTACKPGLVSRYAAETRNSTSADRQDPSFYQQRADWDIDYAENASRAYDLRLCCGALAVAGHILQDQDRQDEPKHTR